MRPPTRVWLVMRRMVRNFAASEANEPCCAKSFETRSLRHLPAIAVGLGRGTPSSGDHGVMQDDEQAEAL